MSAPKRVVVGVLAAVAALPFLIIIWIGMNMAMIGLFVVEGPGWLAYSIYYFASGALVALDVWIGYQASKRVG
jgi:hypothetical protein